MMRFATLLACVASALAAPQGHIPNTASKHGELSISDMFKAEVVDGVGCWWEGDGWDNVVECCGCDKCDKCVRPSSLERAGAYPIDPRSAPQAVAREVLLLEWPLGAQVLPLQARVCEPALAGRTSAAPASASTRARPSWTHTCCPCEAREPVLEAASRACEGARRAASRPGSL
jgi:hypothetical protein